MATNDYKVYDYNVKKVTTAKAPKLQDYEGVKYDDAKYRDNVDTSFYQQSIDKYKDYAEQQRANQIGQADKTKQSSLKQAYVTRLQNEKKLNDNLARSGIRGGATETGMLNIANQYGAARSAANTDYTNSVNAINQSIDQNIFDYTSDMESRAEEYRQNMAQSQWQADREDYANQWQAQNDRTWNIWNARNDARAANAAAINQMRANRANARTEKSANLMNLSREDREYNVTYWANSLSKSSKKDIKKAMNDANKQLKTIDQQIAAAQKKGQKKKVQTLQAKRSGIIAKRRGAAQALANK